MQIIQPDQNRPRQRGHSQHLYIVASEITGRDDRADHLRRDAPHLGQMIARIVLDLLVLGRRPVWSSRTVTLLRTRAVHGPGDDRERRPVGWSTPFAEPHEDVRMQSTALLSFRSVPVVVRDSERSLRAASQELRLDRVHSPLKHAPPATWQDGRKGRPAIRPGACMSSERIAYALKRDPRRPRSSRTC